MLYLQRGVLAALLLVLSLNAYSWNAQRLATPLVIDELIVPFPEFAYYVMPGQEFSVHFKDAQHGGQLTFAGKTMAVGSAPLAAPKKPGLYPMQVSNIAGGESVIINVFVMVPATDVNRQGLLNGYRIGSYPAKALRNNPIYLPPKGFVEVTESNFQVRVSPNFTLGQFVSKQAQGFPNYVLLRPQMLLKLENILAELNRQGHPTDGFVIMSGYRTPWYNKSIGNVPYSRHVWGGASDIFIDDQPRDGVMDDLNGDGKINRADAQWLAEFIDKMSRDGAFGPRIGGLGIYGSNSAHGPFVHVDVRGNRARW